MEKLITIHNKRIIINVQYSQIGRGYSRLFIEVNENEYINLDTTLGACFKMKKSSFEDWLVDAKHISDITEVRKLIEESGVCYEKFLEYLDSL